MPELRFHDNTPVSKPADERPLVEMSSVNENEVSNSMKSIIDDSIKEAINNAIPDIVPEPKTELHEIITAEVKKTVGSMKNEIVQEFQVAYDYLSNQSDAKSDM